MTDNRFRKPSEVQFPLGNDTDYISFSSEEELPSSLTDSEKMNINGLSHIFEPLVSYQTTMRLSGKTLWQLDVLRRLSRKDKINFKSYDAIVSNLLELILEKRNVNDYKDLSAIPFDALKYGDIKNLKRIFYDSTSKDREKELIEVSLPSMTYHPVYIFRLILLAIFFSCIAIGLDSPARCKTVLGFSLFK